MVPLSLSKLVLSLGSPQPLRERAAVGKPTTPDGLVLEAWSQGYMVGSLIILACVTIANMRKGILLHKLVLLELLMAVWHGFWIFFGTPLYAWWLSISAVFLNVSYVIHNVIAWMKLRPFLSRRVSQLFIGTIAVSLVYWGFELYFNFRFFQGHDNMFRRTRPWEALGRDPWWILSTIYLFWIIKSQYEMTLREITRISPRFAIMLLAMIISIIFVIADICAVSGVFSANIFSVNPFWKLATVFKCLTDVVVLDDFKTALDRLRAFQMNRISSRSYGTGDRNTTDRGNLTNFWEEVESEAEAQRRLPDTQMEIPNRQPESGLIIPSHVGHNDGGTSAWGTSNSVTGVPHGLVYSDPSTTNVAPEDLIPSVLRDVPMPESMKEVHVKDDDKRVTWRIEERSERSYSNTSNGPEVTKIPQQDQDDPAELAITRRNS